MSKKSILRVLTLVTLMVGLQSCMIPMSGTSPSVTTSSTTESHVKTTTVTPGVNSQPVQYVYPGAVPVPVSNSISPVVYPISNAAQ